jgi:putative endonuclease
MPYDFKQDTTKEKGDSGESKAVQHLKSLGLDILERNWRFGRLEVDIIAESKTYIVIVEVKTRTSDYLGDPAMAVTIKKQKRLVKAANAYILENDLDKEVRFDVIGIISNQNGTDLKHIEGAFYPLL